MDTVLQFLGRLLGWLRGGAAAASSAVSAVLGWTATLVSGGLQVAGGAVLVFAFARLPRWKLDPTTWWLLWQRLRTAAGAYIMRKRRWLNLYRSFVRNRRRLKYTLIELRLVELVRLTYVFVEDIFFTCYWYYLVMQDYARELVRDFMIYYDDYYLETEDLAFTYWYFYYIFREQVLYYHAARRALGTLAGALTTNRRSYVLQWRLALQRRRLPRLSYYF